MDSPIISVLENTKFNTENDFGVLDIALNLLFTQNKAVWEKGTKERALLLELLSGTKKLTRTENVSVSAVCFMQGCLLLSLSLLNGLGRSPIAVQKSGNTYKVKLLNKLQSLQLTPGVFDGETDKLLREFKQSFFGRTSEASFGKNDLLVIKATFQETILRLKREQAFIERMAEDPLQIFNNDISEEYFASGLFLIVSALPVETMNMLLMHIGSFLPGDLEEKTEDNLSVNVRTYLTTNTQNLHELFKKNRLLLKLYFGRQHGIIAIIVKEKLQDFFRQLLENTNVKNQLRQHLLTSAQDQFALRVKIFDGLVKLL